MRTQRARRRIKQFDIDDAVKSIQALRAALMEAQKQSMMTADLLEDQALMSSSADPAMSALVNSEDYTTAVKACAKAYEHLKQAVSCSDVAKSALRGFNEQMANKGPDDIAVRPKPQMVDPAGKRLSLKQRRQAARLKMQGWGC